MKAIYLRKEPKIPFTQDGYNKLVIERNDLLKKRPEAVDHLRKAREMGDLSENGYYKASRAQLSFIDARLRRANRLIKLATIVAAANNGIIQIGSTVQIKSGNMESEYTIVGGYESDPSQHTISHQSPLGRALMGKRVGDIVEVHAPKKILVYTITNIT